MKNIGDNMRCSKCSLIILLIIILTGCSILQSPIYVNDDVIESILQNEKSLESAFASIKKEANNNGLELREIKIEYSGNNNIQNKNGICTITLFKYFEQSLSDIFYEGGKVEVVTITFSTGNRELLENKGIFNHGRAVSLAAYQLEVVEWDEDIEDIVDSFVTEFNKQISMLENPIIYVKITNDVCLVVLRNNKIVLESIEYNLITD